MYVLVYLVSVVSVVMYSNSKPHDVLFFFFPEQHRLMFPWFIFKFTEASLVELNVNHSCVPIFLALTALDLGS